MTLSDVVSNRDAFDAVLRAILAEPRKSLLRRLLSLGCRRCPLLV